MTVWTFVLNVERLFVQTPDCVLRIYQQHFEEQRNTKWTKHVFLVICFLMAPPTTSCSDPHCENVRCLHLLSWLRAVLQNKSPPWIRAVFVVSQMSFLMLVYGEMWCWALWASADRIICGLMVNEVWPVFVKLPAAALTHHVTWTLTSSSSSSTVTAEAAEDTETQ